MFVLFAHPERLWLAVGLLPMALWLARGARLRSREWEALGQSGRPPRDGSRGWLVAMGLVILALGQPRWGRIFGPDAPPGHDVVLVVDVSRSMAAEDAVPDRLGVAIESASSLLTALDNGEGNRAGVVAFAGRGVVRCPLTSSLDSAVDVLQSLKVGEVEPGGTDLGSALDAALGTFDDEEHTDGRTIVLFSDGEDHVGSWNSIVDRLRAARVIVHSVAIGDPEKSYPVPFGPSNRTPPDETRRSDLAFRELARATGGAVVPLGLASADLGTLFREKIEPTERSRRDALRLPERVERFPAFLLAAIVCGLAASWPGLARRRGGRLAIAGSTVVLAFGTLGAGPSDLVESPAKLIARGQTAYAEGRFAEALEAFERTIAIEPNAAVARYDAASALFQLRRFAEAVVRYEEALERADPGLSLKIEYALGNARAALGDLPGAIAGYDACLASDVVGPSFDLVRDDAQANRDFVVKRMPPQPEKPEGEGPNPGGSKRPRSRGGDSNGDPGDQDPAGSPSPADSPGANPQGKASSGGSRGAGGAGGSGQTPPPAGSPDARLDAALKDIRDARNRRPPEPPHSGSKGVGKDW
jgi:Ca-activated chloride channel family protein